MREHWRFDKRIPIAVILAASVQLAGAVVWATQLDARVESLENNSVVESGLSEKFVRLEERLDSVRQNLMTVRQQLEQITNALIRDK